MSFDPADLARFPQEPGVYLMKDESGGVLYIGKANQLRQRLRQYFSGHDQREMIPHLVAKIETIDTVVVTSEKEALLLEHHLIQKHKPAYNALLKDDSSFPFLRLSNHPWPRLELVRVQGQAKDDGQYFGPYPSAGAARRTMELLQQLFPMRRCSDQELASRSRPCILYDMKRCIAPCVNKCTPVEYAELVGQVERFLKGQDRTIVTQLKKELEEASANLEFERAQQLYDLLRSLEMVFEEQHVHTARGVPTDVWGLYREGDRVAAALLLFREGRLAGARHMVFDSVMESDQELLTTLILQQARMEVPSVILTAIPVDHAPILTEILASYGKKQPSIVQPQRGPKHAMVEMAMRNAVAAFQRSHDAEDQRMRCLFDLQQTCHLNELPERIEIFDTSHLSGHDAVSVCVSFLNGEKESGRYRKYILRDTAPGDDYGALRELLLRRFHANLQTDSLPQLVIVDGGRGHLEVARRLLEEQQLAAIVDVIAVAKESGRHDRGMSLEKIYITSQEDPICLPVRSSLLLFLQRMRDEAHRFAIQFQRSRRQKRQVRSELLKIPGIGPKKCANLLRHFGSVQRILSAEPDAWAACPGITSRDVSALRTWAETHRTP